MPDLIEFNNPRHGILIASRLRKPYINNFDFVVSRSNRGRLVGGVIYLQYTGCAVNMHMAAFSPNWLSRALVYRAFEYPFLMLGVEKALAIVSTGNPRSLALALHLGFVEEARLHNVVPDGTLVILSMVPAACRWLDERPRNNRVIVHPGASNVVR